MKLNKKITFAILLFIAVLLMPLSPLSPSVAAAGPFNSTIDAAWLNSVSDNQSITINTDHRLVYRIHANETGLGENYIFTVRLEHNNSVWTEPNTGFRIAGYTSQAAFPDIILNVEVRNGGTEIVYTLSDPTIIQLEIFVRADARFVYPLETVDITATLYRHQGPNLNQVAENSFIQAHARFPNMVFTGNYELTNPTVMPDGANVINFNYLFMTDGTFNLLSTAGLRLFNRGYVLDFSNVAITINAETRTYAEWRNTSENPVVFTYANGTHISADHRMTVPAPNQFAWRTPLPFRVETNANFTNSPSINFAGLRAYGDMQFNLRGPTVNFSPVVGEQFRTASQNHPWAGVSAYTTRATIIRAHAGGAGTHNIIAYSEQFAMHPVDSHLLYQELFRGFITSTARDGTSSVTVTYEIPDGVTITHIRIPHGAGNPETRFGSISLLKDGKVYHLGNQQRVLDFVNMTELDGQPLAPFQPGENVVFKFEDILSIRPNPGGSVAFDPSRSLAFVGTTNSSVTGGTPLTFSVSTDEAGSTVSSFTTFATNNFYMTSLMSSWNNWIRNANNQPIVAIEVNRQFYFYAHMNTPSYPYNSAHHTNPANPQAFGVFSSPVFYFSLPPGFRISGMDAVEIVTAAGVPTTVTDINGNLITPRITSVHPNAGHYAGGTLVEVKLERADAPNDVFWMRGVTLRLQVYIDPEYDGPETVTILRQSVQLSSWDPRVIDTMSAGSGGTITTLPANAPGLIHAGTRGTIPQPMQNMPFSIISTESVRITGSVMTPLGNLTYTPGDDRTFPQLRAGSSNETFRLFISNDLSDGVFPNAEVYFILPKDATWKPDLNAPARLTTSGFASPSNFTIFYTTDYIAYNNIGNTAVYNHSSLAGFNWNVMAFTGSTAVNTVDWPNVTAVRVSMDLEGSERLELQLPFELPRVNASQGINFGDTARGQTIFSLNSSLRNDDTFTAAVMLVRSYPPNVAAVNPANPVPALFQDVSIDYLNATIPNWYTFYTFDDFTPDLKIREVTVDFTPFVGSPSSVTIPRSSMTSVPYMPQRAIGGGLFEDNVDYNPGFRWTINNPTNYISHGLPGVFRITYITEEDDDSQFSTAVKNITMTKCPTTIGISAVNTHVIWRTDLGMSTQDYFRQFVTATDVDVIGGLADPARVLLVADGGFNISHPGNYTLRFEYTDIGNNRVNTTMVVSVLFNGTLNGTVLGNGMPVEGFAVNIDGTQATTNATGQFAHELMAVVAAPTAVNYNITFTSPVPAGLRHTGTLPISNSGSLARPAPAETINFEAVSMTINVAGPTSGVDSIRLYRVGSASPVAVIDTITSSTVFAKDAGQGWFVAGDYYFVAVLNPGHRVTATSDFTVNSSILDVQTANFAIGNVNLTRNLVIETAPVISGTIWNDVNRDSVMDSNEDVITGATVTLFDATGTTQIQQTATNSSGIYHFVGLNATDSYIVEILLPQGFNRVSPLANDSRIDPVTFRTAPIGFAGGLHVTNIHAGFFAAFTVTYASNGASGGMVPVDNTEYLWNAEATVLGNTGNLWKAGHRFNGWTFNGSTYQPGSTVIVSENVTLSAVWTPLTASEFLSVTYDANGASGGTVPVDNHAYSPNEPATVLGNTGHLWKSGHRFDGWTFNGSTYQAGDTVIVAQNVTLSAVWVPLTASEFLSVTYDANGASGGAVPVDSHAYSPNEPATVLGNTGNLWKSGHRFDGWTFNSSAYQTGDTIRMVENVTLSAVWVPLTAGEFLSVTYNDNGACGGTVPVDNHAYSPNEPLTVLGNTGHLWKANHRFDGWTFNGSTYQAGNTIIMVENVTLTAVWTLLQENEFLFVTYDANGACGGTVPVDEFAYSPNQPATVLDNTGFLWKAGHRFDGWTFNGSAYQPGDTVIVAENVTLSAVWVPLTAGEFLFATYEPNGAHRGTVPVDSHAYSPNEPKTVLGNTGGLARDGFVFAGWTYDDERFIAGDTIRMVENVTLSAAWGARPPGTGNATIVDRPSGSAILGDDDPPNVPDEPYVTYEEPQREEPRNWWWLWLLLLLLLLLILYAAYRRYKAKKAQESMK